MRLPAFNKPHLDFPQQVAVLKSRGMIVESEAAAEECLHRIGYYRLATYWYPFREDVPGAVPPAKKDTFQSGTKFQYALDLYVYDKNLRLLLLDAIERVEIAARVDVAHHMGQIDSFAYTKPALLDGNFLRPGRRANNRPAPSAFTKWTDKYEEALNRSHEVSIEEFLQKYSLPLPIWLAVEVWDFGQLSHFYNGMRVPDRVAVAARYGIPDWRLMKSWLWTLNNVRNIVAHHGRLWNRNMDIRPVLPQRGTMPAFDPLIGNTNALKRIYSVCCILAHFMDQSHPRSEWKNRLVKHINGFPASTGLSVAEMGFPADWANHDFWRAAVAKAAQVPVK